jgi:hypothetical protein
VYDDLVRLFDVADSPGRDLTLVVGGRRIHCHRVVLALRSAHFRSVFAPTSKTAPPPSMRAQCAVCVCVCALAAASV